MLKIVVCDDEAEICKNISLIIERLTCNNKLSKAEVLVCYNGESLLKENDIDLVLLDIDMPGMSGMEAAARLSERKNAPLIVFVTAHDELVYDSFKYHPFAFVRKKYLEEELTQVLMDCKKEFDSRDKYFSFKSGGDTVKLLSSDIMYFEAEANYLIIHIANETYRMRATISGIEDNLKNEGFIRIHKGFLVNQEHIRTLKQGEVVLESGDMLPIGKAYAASAKASILRYMR